MERMSPLRLVVPDANCAYVSVNNNKKLGSAYGVVEPNEREMLHGLCTVHSRIARLRVTETPAKARPGFFRWLANAMMHSRQRQADREIARYLNNGKFTDEIRARNRAPVSVDAATLLEILKGDRDQ